MAARDIINLDLECRAGLTLTLTTYSAGSKAMGPGERGNLMIEIKIQLPTKIKKSQKEPLEKLQETGQ